MGVASGFLILGAAVIALLLVGTKGAGAAAAAQTAVNSSSTPVTTTAPASGSAPASVQGAVRSVAAGKGWGPAEVAAWLGVIAKEDASGSLTATNPGSGAYGIAQFINGAAEYGQYGGSPGTLIGQITAMGNYIQQRYGTPTAALAHENSYGWY